jgi:hypothetical protein
MREALLNRVTKRARSRKPFKFFECAMYSSNFACSQPGKLFSLAWVKWFYSLNRGDRVEVAGLDEYYCRFVRLHPSTLSNLVLVEYLGADLKWHRSYVRDRLVSMSEAP